MLYFQCEYLDKQKVTKLGWSKLVGPAGHYSKFFRSKFAVDWKLSHITKKRLLKLFFFVFHFTDNGCVDKKKRTFF